MNDMESKDPILLLGAVTDRRLAALRVILAVAGLFIIYLIPSDPGRYVALAYYTLIAYIAYSVVVYAMSRRLINFSRTVLQSLIWLDLAWYTVLVALTDGANSYFFFFYLFTIIVASSRGGYTFGLLVTGASAAICVAMAVLLPTENFDIPRFAIRQLSIVGFGYILSYWGGAETALRRKMALLNDLSLVANPRFGVDWTIELILRRLLSFWRASYCLILLVHDDELDLYLVSSDDPQRCQKVPVRSQSDVPFIDMSDYSSLVYNDQPRRWARRKSFQSYDPRTSAIAPRALAPGEALAEFLSARSFVSVPLHYRERFRGRIVVSSVQPQTFDIGDAAFLQQVASQALPLIENIRLVERLASDASEEERNRIARSVHDRVIQPYYGLQIGLKALHSVLNQGQNANGTTGDEERTDEKKPAALLAELMSMTSDGIDELRQYVSGLKQSRSGDTRLADSIRRFATKFEHATGIHVKVTDYTEGFVGNDRLTSEMFQMAAEALSNVHRHTQARSARVALKLEGNVIRLQVENDRGKDSDPGQFTPGSITDRAEALGGRTEVLLEDDRTVLRVEVPL